MRPHPLSRLSSSLAALLASVPATFARAASDPVEGKWLGTAGGPENTSVFGLEIRAGEHGALAGKLYLAMLNSYGQPLPSFTAAGDGKYRVAEFGLELALDGDRLAGTLGPKAPVELKRIDGAMPSDPPLPADLPRGPGPSWELALGSALWCAPSTRDGVAYVGCEAGVMNAIRLSDRSFVWTFAAGRPLFGEALVSEDSLYFVCDNGFLFKLAREDGKELWRYDLGDAQVPRVLPHPQVFEYDHSAPRPVLADGVVFVGSGDGAMHAVRADDGERAWRVEGRGKIRVDAAVQGERVVFATLDGVVLALERAGGKEVWRRAVKAPVTSSPAYFDDALVIGTRGSLLAALTPDTGATKWMNGWWGSWIESTPVPMGEGRACIGSSDLRRVTCFEPASGRTLWRTDVFGWSWGRPLVTETSVFVATGGVEPYSIRHVAAVSALDPHSGAIQWRFPLDRPAGAMHWGFVSGCVRSGDEFVAGSLEGVLYGFPIRWGR